jgi:hypothetical protein
VLGTANAKSRRASAVQEWEAAQAAALAKVRRIDLLVENVLKDNPIAKSEYEAARTIPRAARRRSEKAAAEAAAA